MQTKKKEHSVKYEVGGCNDSDSFDHLEFFTWVPWCARFKGRTFAVAGIPFCFEGCIEENAVLIVFGFL